MFRKNGRGMRRLKKFLWHIHQPEWALNHGVKLPVRHDALSPGIRKQIHLGEYESKEAEIVTRRLHPDDVVMEVGAGIGFLSALCAKRIGNDRVFAYEANPALMDIIALTHRANGVTPSVINAALAVGEGECAFHLSDEFWASSASHAISGARVIMVRQLDLNTELAKVRPTFLIVDIEGGEREFFSHANLAGVRKVCVELHPTLLSDVELSGLLQHLFAQGFVLDFSIMRKNVFFLYRP